MSSNMGFLPLDDLLQSGDFDLKTDQLPEVEAHIVMGRSYQPLNCRPDFCSSDCTRDCGCDMYNTCSCEGYSCGCQGIH